MPTPSCPVNDVFVILMFVEFVTYIPFSYFLILQFLIVILLLLEIFIPTSLAALLFIQCPSQSIVILSAPIIKPSPVQLISPSNSVLSVIVSPHKLGGRVYSTLIYGS